MLQRIKFWKRDEEGATAVEYGIMVALIAVVILVGVGLLGDSLNDLFTDVSTEIDDAAPEGDG